jgi:hypothetical protein
MFDFDAITRLMQTLCHKIKSCRRKFFAETGKMQSCQRFFLVSQRNLRVYAVKAFLLFITVIYDPESAAARCFFRAEFRASFQSHTERRRKAPAQNNQ